MTYNTGRDHLILPEYGRNVQQMVDHALTIEDREERNLAARTIIRFMGQLNPHLRDVADFNHKLWDHLFIMSNYQLDVDSPYPFPDKEKVERKPDKLEYPTHKIAYRYYGFALEEMVQKAIELEEGEEKTVLTGMLANIMKRFYLKWNRDSVNDDDIWKQLSELSGGRLQRIEGFEMSDTAEILKSNQQRSSNSGKKRSNKKSNKRKNHSR